MEKHYLTLMLKYLDNLFGKIIGKNNTINIGYDGRLSSVSLKKIN